MELILWITFLFNMLIHSSLITITFGIIMKGNFVQMPFLTQFQEESKERELYTKRKIGTFTDQILRQIDQICENEGMQMSFPIPAKTEEHQIQQQETPILNSHNQAHHHSHVPFQPHLNDCVREKREPLSLLRIPSPSTSPPSPASDWSSNTPMTLSSFEKSKDDDLEPATPFSALYKSTDLSGYDSIDQANGNVQSTTMNSIPPAFVEPIRFDEVDEAPSFDDARKCIKEWLQQARSFDKIHPRKNREDRKGRKQMEKRLAWINLEEYSVTILHAIQSQDRFGGYERMAETLWISHSSFPIGYESCRSKTLQQDPLIYPTSFWLMNKNSARFLKHRTASQGKQADLALAVRRKAIDSITSRSPVVPTTKTIASDLDIAQAPIEKKLQDTSEEDTAEITLKEAADLSTESQTQNSNDRFSVAWAQDELWRLNNPLWKQSYDHCWMQHLESIEDEEKAAISNFFFVSADQWFSDTPITNYDLYDETLQNADFAAFSSGEMAELEEEMLKQQGEALESRIEGGGFHTDMCQPYQSKVLPYPQIHTAAENYNNVKGEGHRPERNDQRFRRLSNASYSSLSITNGAAEFPKKWFDSHIGSTDSHENHAAHHYPTVPSSSPSLFALNQSDQIGVCEEPVHYTLEPANYHQQSSLESAQQENEALRTRVLELQQHLSFVANEQQQHRHDTIQVMEDQFTAFASLDELHHRHSQALSHALQWQAYGQQQYVSLWTNAAQAMHSYIDVQNRVVAHNFDQNMARLRKQRNDSKRHTQNRKNDKVVFKQRNFPATNNDGGESSLPNNIADCPVDLIYLDTPLTSEMRRANSLNDECFSARCRGRGLGLETGEKVQSRHLSPNNALGLQNSSPVISPSTQQKLPIPTNVATIANNEVKNKRTNNKPGSRKANNHNRWKGNHRNQESTYTASSPLVKPTSRAWT